MLLPEDHRLARGQDQWYLPFISEVTVHGLTGFRTGGESVIVDHAEPTGVLGEAGGMGCVRNSLVGRRGRGDRMDLQPLPPQHAGKYPFRLVADKSLQGFRFASRSDIFWYPSGVPMSMNSPLAGNP